MTSRNRLEIRENPDNPVPDQWYKDEGGRENCVELQVFYDDLHNDDSVVDGGDGGEDDDDVDDFSRRSVVYL